ncbi:ankyrin repeat protein [Acanthamoeba polyphaga moumouvirus]|uniref:Ankyrin repeat protein n=1 Tax=Acanthamoeba polyphaga moumouvirus TaxID=1269028 RepID=L7RBS1_9VIRU|nr:ankyrin repeat protein [Acanthamoeba polyphaga moumouvirus]AGC01581.1 ankyrin repeat protein [Acanthamoeba polyphaga moumouvirus]
MSSKLYLKITNKDECHHGFQYQDGLNILEGKFNDNPKELWGPGRLYFTEAKYIHNYLYNGIHLRDVYLPKSDPDFKMMEDPRGGVYGANMIILGKRRDLRDPSTWDYMISIGVDIYAQHDFICAWACRKAYLEIVKYLVNKRIFTRKYNINNIEFISKKNHYAMFKYNIKNGKNVDLIDIEAFKHLFNSEKNEILKYLINNGINIYLDKGEALIYSCEKGKLEMVKYLIENGANVHVESEKPLKLSSRKGYFEILQYLVNNGANVSIGNDYVLRHAVKNRHKEMIIFLLKKREEFTNQKLVRRLINKYVVPSINN